MEKMPPDMESSCKYIE